MDVDALCEAATAATGLDDFGDPAFRAPLELFLRSGETDGRLTAIGDAALEGMALGNLVNRLRVVDWHSQNPAAGSTAVERPIFLIGLPRTGTTALSHLLSVDPDNRSLLNWEAVDSVPPPTRDWRNDPRFLAALEAPDMLDMINPEFKTIHHDPVDMPVECAVLLGQSFMSLHLTTTFNLPSYMDALFDLDHTPAYEYHRLVLQLLQSANPGRWQLKSPVHLVDPWALAATYPDARFVLTHRDPVQIVASVCSLVRSLAGTFTDADWNDWIRTTWPAVIATLLDNQSRFRDELTAAGRGDAFVDLSYADMVRDPIATVADLYRSLDEPFTEEAETAMRDHSARHVKDRFGRHTYSLEDWNLDGAVLAERFSDYTDRYAKFLEPR